MSLFPVPGDTFASIQEPRGVRANATRGTMPPQKAIAGKALRHGADLKAGRRVLSVLLRFLRDPAPLRARYLLLNERKGLISALRPAHLAEECPERLIVEP